MSNMNSSACVDNFLEEFEIELKALMASRFWRPTTKKNNMPSFVRVMLHVHPKSKSFPSMSCSSDKLAFIANVPSNVLRWMINLTEGYKFKLHTLVVTCFFTLSDNHTFPKKIARSTWWCGQHQTGHHDNYCGYLMLCYPPPGCSWKKS